MTQRVAAVLGGLADIELLGNIELKGLSRPVAVLNVGGLTTAR